MTDTGYEANADKGEYITMMKNTTRGILGLVLTAAATWLANFLVDKMFGPDEEVA